MLRATYFVRLLIRIVQNYGFGEKIEKVTYELAKMTDLGEKFEKNTYGLGIKDFEISEKKTYGLGIKEFENFEKITYGIAIKGSEA